MDKEITIKIKDYDTQWHLHLAIIAYLERLIEDEINLFYEKTPQIGLKAFKNKIENNEEKITEILKNLKKIDKRLTGNGVDFKEWCIAYAETYADYLEKKQKEQEEKPKLYPCELMPPHSRSINNCHNCRPMCCPQFGACKV